VAEDLAAPELADPPFAAAERAMLESWLDFHRGMLLLLTCDGLSDAARHGLDDVGVAVGGGQRAEFSLHRIYHHMIEVT
jgi:hypothetical protein